jgi:hypothetical protein
MNSESGGDRMTIQNQTPAWLQLHTEPPVWLTATVDDLLNAWAVEAIWQARRAGARTPSPVRRTGPLVDALREMSHVPHSSLLAATKTPWTAMFAASGGRTPNAFELAPLVPCGFARFHFTGDNGIADQGFYWYAAPTTDAQALRTEPVRHRSVRLWHENDEWHFEQYGQPLSFEDATAYRRPKRGERLSATTLQGYADELKIPLADIGDYAGETALLLPMEWPDPPLELSSTEDAALTLQWQRMNLARLHGTALPEELT